MQEEYNPVAILIISHKVRAYNSNQVGQHLLNPYKRQVLLEVLYKWVLSD